MPRRVDVDLVPLGEDLAGQGIQLRDPFDVVAEELHADREVFVRRLHFERVAPNAELATHQIRVRALVLDVNEVAEHRVAPDPLALVQPDGDRAVVDRRAEAVDAGDRGDDDHVAALEQRPGRRMPHLVDLFVPGAVLLDVGVAPGDVRLRLVVVVVRDEVLDGVLWEKLLELAVKLRRERLVVGEDQRRPPGLGDDLRHRHGLARPGDAPERYMPVAGSERAQEPGRRRRLVTAQLPGERETERRPGRWPVDRDLEGLASGHGFLHSRTDVQCHPGAERTPHCRASTPVRLPFSCHPLLQFATGKRA